ncbi:hypothetical protein FBU30_009684 [Linnemannia zychae]|nr:hypothetical protein FBU30_009684 [Linnemannia zychae]
MTAPEFDDADFDIKDISSILRDIDSVNLALDSLDGRADRLTANLASLLKAQSQPNPYANVEALPVDKDEQTALSESSATAAAATTVTTNATPSAPEETKKD